MRTPDDARRDPQPGDVFRKGREQRTVTALPTGWPEWWQEEYVRFTVKNGSPFRIARKTFLRWAANAEVLEVVDE